MSALDSRNSLTAASLPLARYRRTSENRSDGAYVNDGEVFENRALVIVLLDASDSDVDSLVNAALDLDGVSSVAKETYGSEFGIVTN